MMAATAAAVALTFTNCCGPDNYYTDGSGQIYYNVIPVDSYIGYGRDYGEGPLESKEYYHRGVYHRGDFRKERPAYTWSP